MNADNPRTFRGRLAELSPFEIKVTEAAKVAACKSVAAACEMSGEELYGCVDWYQYPRQAERESVEAYLNTV